MNILQCAKSLYDLVYPPKTIRPEQNILRGNILKIHDPNTITILSIAPIYAKTCVNIGGIITPNIHSFDADVKGSIICMTSYVCARLSGGPAVSGRRGVMTRRGPMIQFAKRQNSHSHCQDSDLPLGRTGCVLPPAIPAPSLRSNLYILLHTLASISAKPMIPILCRAVLISASVF